MTKKINGQTRLYSSFPVTKPLTKTETNALLAQANAGDIKARNKLVEHNLRYICKMAHYMYRKGPNLEFGDLLNAGIIGFIKAIELKKFDPSRNIHFVSWASFYVQASIRKLLYKSYGEFSFDKSAATKCFFDNWSTIKDIENIQDSDIKNQCREEFLAKLTKKHNSRKGMSLSVLTKTYYQVASYKFLNFNVDPGQIKNAAEMARWTANDSHLEEVIEDDLQEKKEVLVKKMLAHLTERERLVITEYVTNEDTETLQAIGDRLGVSRERIRQIKKRTLNKLRENFQEEAALLG